MMTEQEKKAFVAGGSFLTSEHTEIFTPEDFTDEHLMMAESTERFVDEVIMPQSEKLEKTDIPTIVQILKQAGELGLLSTEVPESYGGMELSKAGACLVAEKMAKTGGFVVSFGGHTGIGTMPITYFGTRVCRWPLTSSPSTSATGIRTSIAAASATSALSSRLRWLCPDRIELRVRWPNPVLPLLEILEMI